MHQDALDGQSSGSLTSSRAHQSYTYGGPLVILAQRPAAFASPDLEELLPHVVQIVAEAGERLAARYSEHNRVADESTLLAALRANEEASAPTLTTALTRLRPEATWLAKDLESASLPPGEFWVADAVEGNINHVHGLPQWCVSVTLVAESRPVLTVVRQPTLGRTFTAVRGGGAWLNGRRLQVSPTSSLTTAVVATGQAEAGQTGTYEQIGSSITAMLHSALVVQAIIPSTFPLLFVASGQYDAFWQYEPTLPGVAAGILLAEEAGGVVSRIDGRPWATGSSDILVTTPLLHQATVAVLAAAA